MKRLIASCVAGSLAASLACEPCFAWGDDGHKIVATIATSQLSEPAQRALRELLGDETVADAAVWADKVRSDAQYDWIKPLHYINVPRNATSLDMARDGNDGKQVVTSILKYRDILKDTTKPKEERLLALRLLIHFVGDLHQPFHVSYKEDLGGNKLTVQAFGRKSNMHKVWDTDLIQRRLRDTKGGWATMSADLRQAITDDQRKAWAASTNPVDWANESFAITLQLYAKAPGNDGVNDDYYKQWNATLNARLQAAGVRLGAMLNDTLKAPT
jgi:hypothetical protein